MRFLFDTAKLLDVAFGYVHHAADVAAQETTDAVRYELLSGAKAPSDPVKPEDRPGRSTYAGQYLISCRWLTMFGGRLSSEIGISTEDCLFSDDDAFDDNTTAADESSVLN